MRFISPGLLFDVIDLTGDTHSARWWHHIWEQESKKENLSYRASEPQASLNIDANCSQKQFPKIPVREPHVVSFHENLEFNMRQQFSVMMAPQSGTRQETESKRFTKSENEFVKAKSHMNSFVLIKRFGIRRLKISLIFQSWCFHHM